MIQAITTYSNESNLFLTDSEYIIQRLTICLIVYKIKNLFELSSYNLIKE